jgi:hypothetical protein
MPAVVHMFRGVVPCVQVRAVLLGQDDVEFPFRVSEQELNIIERMSNPPASMLLLGRSGTGKTTVSWQHAHVRHFLRQFARSGSRSSAK